MRKRIISACLALCLALSLLPVNVRAADVIVIQKAEDLIPVLTCTEGAITYEPTVDGDTVTLSDANNNGNYAMNVTVDSPLRISCDITIDLKGCTLEMGANYIQVDSGAAVKIENSEENDCTIKSSSDTATVIAMRGCDLTIDRVHIEAAKGYGIMLDPDPQTAGQLQTELNLSNLYVSGYPAGVYVHEMIREVSEGEYPVLILDNVSAQGSLTDGAGLYLAGMADTTIQNSSGLTHSIDGAVGIGIKSGILKINQSVEITGHGAYQEPSANEDGITCDGSAILVENNSAYAGYIDITIGEDVRLVSNSSYALREFTVENGTHPAPKIAIKSNDLVSWQFTVLDSIIKTDQAQIVVPKEGWELLPKEPQTIQAYGKNDETKEAYEKAGLKLRLRTDADSWKNTDYIFDIDTHKLSDVLDGENEYKDILTSVNDPAMLCYTAEYEVPERLKGKAEGALITVGEYPEGMSLSEFETAEFTGENSFHYAFDFTASDSYKIATILWLDENGDVLAVATANIGFNSISPWTVWFESGWGSPEEVEVSPGEKVEKPEDPEDWTNGKQKFDGWYLLDEDGEYKTKWDFEKDIVTQDIRLYAKWLQFYRVQFDSQGGSEVKPNPQIVDEGKPVTKPANPTKEGFVFDDWYKEKDCLNQWDFAYKVERDTVLYANWLPVHTVTFNSQKGSAVPIQEVVDSGTVPKPADPTRKGYRFDGWFKEAECKNEWNFKTNTVSGPITLYAKWQKTYDVKFDSRGGSEVKPNPQIVDEGKPVTKPANPTKEGFVFDDWYKEKDCLNQWNFDYKVNADVTLYAGWTKAPYTITFHANGGFFTPDEDTVTTPTGEDGKPVEFPADPSRTGYTFDGWYTAREDGEQITTDTVFEKDTTLYAHWKAGSTVPPTPSKPKIYDITFDANGGGSNVTVTTGIDGRLSTLPDPPSYTGHTFEGWYTSASGGTQITKDTVFQGHTTVYAHWKESSGQPSGPSNPSNPSNPSGAQYQIYTPNYTSGGSLYVSRTTAAEGDRVTIRLTPWSGYRLYQLLVTNYATGRQLSLSRVSANEYAFTMPASGVSVTATFTGGTSSTQSQTTNQSAGWYFSGSSIYHRTSGLVPSGNPLTRDMLISVLYNLDGSSHEEPAVWAVSSGIVPDVYSSLLWGGDKSLTREQTAAILYCYAGYKGYGASQRVSLAGYTDYSEIRAAAQPAMSWAAAAGLMTGTSASTLSPQANMTCAQAGIVLSRFITSVVRAR